MSAIDEIALERDREFKDKLILLLTFGSPNARQQLLDLGILPDVVQALLTDAEVRQQAIEKAKQGLAQYYKYADNYPEWLHSFNPEVFARGMVTGYPDAQCQMMLSSVEGIDFLWRVFKLQTTPYYQRTQERFIELYKSRYYTRQCLDIGGRDEWNLAICAERAGQFGEDIEILDRDYPEYAGTVLEGAVRGDHLDIVKAYAGRPDTLGDAGYYFTNAQSLAVAQALYDAGLRPRSISIFATLGRRVVNLDIINFYLDVFDIATLAPVMDFATMSIPIVERVKYHLSGIHRFRPVANLKYLIGKCIVCATGLDLLKAVLEHPNIQRYRPYELLPKVLDDYIERDAVKDPAFITKVWEYIDSKRQ